MRNRAGMYLFSYCLPLEGAAAVEMGTLSRFMDIKHKQGSYLIKYGIREANKQPTAAHKRDKPEPLETSIPKGILVVFKINPFTDSELLMAVVQSEAPVKTKTVAMRARQADTRKAKVRLKTPLKERL